MRVQTWQSLSPIHRQNTITKEAWRLVRVITGEASKTHEVDHAILEISRLSPPLKRWADWISNGLMKALACPAFSLMDKLVRQAAGDCKPH